MSIHLYAVCWNEERIIPFFLRHYEPLVDRIAIYDDGSTDRSVELLRASPKVEIRPFKRDAESYLDAHVALFETCWQESRGRADWVCLVDLDEFLFHPDWHDYLAAQKNAGVTIIQALGYDMVSETFPPAGVALTTMLTRGQRDLHLDKTGLFAPDAIEQINYSVGRHRCSPVAGSYRRLIPCNCATTRLSVWITSLRAPMLSPAGSRAPITRAVGGRTICATTIPFAPSFKNNSPRRNLCLGRREQSRTKDPRRSRGGVVWSRIPDFGIRRCTERTPQRGVEAFSF
jgi:hypothetical protein